MVVACGAAERRERAAPPPERLEQVAKNAVEDELRARGFQVEERAVPGDKPVLLASRGATSRWSLALAVESPSDERGRKWILRVTVFHEPGRELKGEIAPSALVPGGEPDASGRRDLVRALGKRATEQFTENFE